MIRKIILGATLFLFAMNASALLMLINNEATVIQILCNGIPGLFVPAKGILFLPYYRISARFLSRDLQCTFTDGQRNTGHAHLVIQPNYQTAQMQSYDPKTGVAIAPASALTQPASDITVTLDML